MTVSEWIDELSVTQVVEDGMRLPLRGAELRAAYLSMRGKLPIDIIAWRLCINERALYRYLTTPKPKKPKAPKPPRVYMRQPCGTNSGYDRHYRNGEKPCAACREARNRYKKELYRRKKESLDET